tara:strand:+ start:186 stop:368 length:183 start_codon:yes stop_codon:yes gene_type:complete
MEQIKKKYCVYLDVELTEWLKRHSAGEYRSFSSFLNKLMKQHKDKIEKGTTVKVLKSETN